MCHPDRSEAEWRDLLFQLFASDLHLNIYAANFRFGTLEPCGPAREAGNRRVE
jgi:hypothetical protein